jgi:hypothetical protein
MGITKTENCRKCAFSAILDAPIGVWSGLGRNENSINRGTDVGMSDSDTRESLLKEKIEAHFTAFYMFPPA